MTQAMEMYRLNVLERIGREEGSQIVVYGLGGRDAEIDRLISSAAAGAMLHRRDKTQEAPPAAEATPPR